MGRQEALEQYQKALKRGQKEYKDLVSKGKDPYPAVLSDFISDTEGCVSIGLVEIPAYRIVGTKTAGRISAFTAGFLPLLTADTEFATKWIALCEAHLGDEGIRDPIVCYEYLGEFYVQEGNKRVSVLRSFDAARIPGQVYRVKPPADDSPRAKAYAEFLEFYKHSGLYDVRFTQPGQYAKLSKAVGIPAGQDWTESDRRRFRAYFQYFRDAFYAQGGAQTGVEPEDAMLLWLELRPYSDLGELTASALEETLEKMWANVVALASPAPEVRTQPPEEKKAGIISKIIAPDFLSVAFVHQRTAAASPWTRAHESGRKHLEEALGNKVVTHSYFNADNAELAEQALEAAIAGGADVIFTTTPQLIAPSLKISVKYPKVRILNCSVDMPYSTVRTYYSRIYEGKFITGAIAGAMAKNDRIGYVGSYPIHGVPASINAFALGAQMTNPRAKIELKWSCQKGNPTQEFLRSGIRVISNRDTPVEDRLFHEYGTYIYNEDGVQMPLASPIWKWGQFYENVIRSILNGAWDAEKPTKAVNHWWGMDSGVIDVTLSDKLPDGVAWLAGALRIALQRGLIDPFQRRIVAQDGTVKNDGSRPLTPEELLQMDWLCENVSGSIPRPEEVLPFAKPMVRLQGVFPESTDGEGKA